MCWPNRSRRLSRVLLRILSVCAPRHRRAKACKCGRGIRGGRRRWRADLRRWRGPKSERRHHHDRRESHRERSSSYHCVPVQFARWPWTVKEEERSRATADKRSSPAKRLETRAATFEQSTDGGGCLSMHGQGKILIVVELPTAGQGAAGLVPKPGCSALDGVGVFNSALRSQPCSRT